MKLNPLSMQSTLDCYPENALSAVIECNIAGTLPPIESLVPGLTQDQRVAVYRHEASKARSLFCALYGDPFGCDEVVHLAQAPDAEGRRRLGVQVETL